MQTIIKQLEIGPMGNFAYIVADKATKKACVIDPGWDVNNIIAESNQLGFVIDKILLTHAHFDHARGATKLAEETHAKIYVHKDEPLKFPNDEVVTFDDGGEIKLGEVAIKCIHTPGHSPGSTCFMFGDDLFTGDVLFVDGIGRCDLPGGSDIDMMASLKKLAKLPDQIRIFPGHNYGSSNSSTIGEQRHSNPYLVSK